MIIFIPHNEKIFSRKISVEEQRALSTLCFLLLNAWGKHHEEIRSFEMIY